MREDPPRPLAERLRPVEIEQVIGQPIAVRLLRGYLNQGQMPNTVFWGPPGTGKTSLSRLMARSLDMVAHHLNATSASVKDIRAHAEQAKRDWQALEQRTLVFVDEIHRLNKAQQDVLLPFTEDGTFVLSGSTTENPFFALNHALRSRLQLIRLEPLSADIVEDAVKRAAAGEGWPITDGALQMIARRSSGDLRLAYGTLESARFLVADEARPIEPSDVHLCLTQTQVPGDRAGDQHYDLASAFQKSLRGSDADAAVYYLARLLESGEDPRFVARRLLVTASEDVGNADPQALVIASHAFRSVEVLGLPEARIPLSQAAIYVARAPKSKQAIRAVDAAASLLRDRPLDPVPVHLRDGHYRGAKELKAELTDGRDHSDSGFLPSGLHHIRLVDPPTPKENAPPTRDIERVFQSLSQASDWFEIDLASIAQETELIEPQVRAALNDLVGRGRLEFKRLFRVARSSTADQAGG